MTTPIFTFPRVLKHAEQALDGNVLPVHKLSEVWSLNGEKLKVHVKVHRALSWRFTPGTEGTLVLLLSFVRLFNGIQE